MGLDLVTLAAAKSYADSKIQGGANIQPLTFTGAVDVIYDGSKPVEVVIPQGGGGDNWELLGEVTLEQPVKRACISIPESITEVVLYIRQLGGDSANQVISAVLWDDGWPSYQIGTTRTSTTHSRAVVRARKIKLQNGEEYVDLVSAATAAGAASATSTAGMDYSGNMLAQPVNNYIGVEKISAQEVLPVGFSFKVYGR